MGTSKAPTAVGRIAPPFVYACVAHINRHTHELLAFESLDSLTSLSSSDNASVPKIQYDSN